MRELPPVPGTLAPKSVDTKFRYESTNKRNPNHKFQWFANTERIPVLCSDGQALTQQELDSLVLQHEFQSRLFDLSVPEDMAAYNDVMDKIYNGWYAKIDKQQRWPEGRTHPTIWLEWAIRYKIPRR